MEEEILIEASILAVADVVEAMASHRPYPRLGIEEALNEIEKNRGIFYDEAVADACESFAQPHKTNNFVIPVKTGIQYY